MFKQYLLIIGVIFSVMQFSEISYAQYVTGPLSSALGGAGRGAADDGEQLFLNPAAIVHNSPFTSSLFYLDGYQAKNEHDRILGLSLADNSEDTFCAGGYAFVSRRRTFDGSDSVDDQYHQISLGGYVYKHVALGMAFTYLKSDVERGDKFDQYDANIGFHYNPRPEWGYGLVFYNVNGCDKDVPEHIQNQDKISAGMHYIYKPTLRFRFDMGQQLTNNPDSKMDLQLGFETRPKPFFVTRVGVEKEGATDRDLVTFGLGFDGPRLKFDYSYRKNTDYSGGAMHGVDMRMPFW